MVSMNASGTSEGLGMLGQVAAELSEQGPGIPMLRDV